MKHASIVFASGLFVVWAYALTQTHLRVDSLGIFNSFPIYYFIPVSGAIGLLEWQLYSNKASNLTQFLALVFVILSINVIPTFIGGVPRSVTGALSFQWQIDTVTKFGSLSPVSSQLYLSGGYPSFIIFFSSLFQLIGKNPQQFDVRWVFIFWQLFYLPFLLLIARETVGTRFMWAIPTFFYLFQWLSFNSIAPETLGFALFLVLMCLLFDKNPRSSKTLLLYVIVSSALILSHGLSSLFGLGVVCVLVLVRRDIPWRYPVIFAVILASWLAFASTEILDIGVPSILSYLSNPASLLYQGLFARVASPNTGHQLLGTVRVAYTGMFLMVGAIGLLSLLVYNRRNADKSQISLLAGVAVIATLIGYGYGAEIIDKTLLFAAIGIAYIASQGLSRKRIRFVFLAVLIISPGFYVISAFGDQYVSTVPHAVITGLSYFDQYTPGGGVVVGNMLLWGSLVFNTSTPYLGRPIAYSPNPTFLVGSNNYGGATFEKIQSELEKTHALTGQTFVAVSSTDEEIYTWNYNDPTFLTNLAHLLNTNLDRVYDSQASVFWYG